MNPLEAGGEWLYKIVYTFIVAFVIIALVSLGIPKSPDTIEVQRATFISNVIYNPDIITYVDTSGTHVGVIDVSKFDTGRLTTAAIYPDNYGGAQLELVTRAGTRTAYINKPTYDKLRTQALAGISRGGSLESHSYPVRVFDGYTETDGYLILTVAMPHKT